MKTLEFRETSQADLKQVQALWSCGEVMKFVGFPNGLHQTGAQMEEWLGWIISARPKANHYSIYEDGIYCGEAFYQIDERTRSAALDIKLLPFARGRESRHARCPMQSRPLLIMAPKKYGLTPIP